MVDLVKGGVRKKGVLLFSKISLKLGHLCEARLVSEWALRRAVVDGGPDREFPLEGRLRKRRKATQESFNLIGGFEQDLGGETDCGACDEKNPDQENKNTEAEKA